MDYSKKLITMGSSVVGIACACCGTAITKGKRYLACPDCGAIFCEDCVQDSTFDNHQCADYDYPDPAEYDFCENN